MGGASRERRQGSMVVMTVACGDSGRAEQNKASRCRREGSDKERARFPHRT